VPGGECSEHLIAVSAAGGDQAAAEGEAVGQGQGNTGPGRVCLGPRQTPGKKRFPGGRGWPGEGTRRHGTVCSSSKVDDVIDWDSLGEV